MDSTPIIPLLAGTGESNSNWSVRKKLLSRVWEAHNATKLRQTNKVFQTKQREAYQGSQNDEDEREERRWEKGKYNPAQQNKATKGNYNWI